MDENSSAAVGYQFDPIRDSLSEPHFRNDYDKNEEIKFWVRLCQQQKMYMPTEKECKCCCEVASYHLESKLVLPTIFLPKIFDAKYSTKKVF